MDARPNDDDIDLTETDPALEDTVAEVELDESLEAIEKSPARAGDHDSELEGGEMLLEGFDPEAHHINVSQRKTIRRQITSEGGQFVLGLLVMAGALGVAAWAIAYQSKESLIVAGVVSPPALLWFFLRWRKWLAGAPYAYRLLTSLGEDADNILDERRQKQLRKGVRVDEGGSEKR
ncbi:MAG: hypothetical protein R3B57_01750 [Phycisphaerales bacterium]